MGTFKGTKGKWVKNGKNGIHTEKGICVALSFTEEREANALLVSKAPDMLDIIEESVINLKILRDQIDFESKVNNRFEGLQHVISNWIERQEQLIKEATEL